MLLKLHERTKDKNICRFSMENDPLLTKEEKYTNKFKKYNKT